MFIASRVAKKPTQFLLIIATFVVASTLFNYSSYSNVAIELSPDEPILAAETSYPSYPLSPNISQGCLIANQILRTWKTNNRIEIEAMSINGSDHPERFNWFKTWDTMNPQATQLLFNDEDMDRFVRGSFSQRVVEAYFKLPRVVLRADFARYMMLYELGGYYADMDVSCRNPIYQWNLGMNGIAVIVGVEDPKKEERDSVLQWAMASARHHPFMAQVIDRVTNKIHSASVEELLNVDAVLDITGPGIWKQVVWEYLESKGVDLLANSNMWVGHQRFGDFLLLGKAYLNNDNSDNPEALIRHHFTGFTEYGWRQQAAVYADETKRIFSEKSKPKLSQMIHPEPYQYRKLLPSLIRNPSQTTTEIPKVIVQVCNTSNADELDVVLQGRHKSWEALNPEYTVVLMSDKEMDSFVKQECSDVEKKAFFLLPLLMWRVELFKLLWLVKRGGVYAEVDTQCHQPIRKWFNELRTVGLQLGFKSQHHNPPGIARSIITSIPNHSLLAQYAAEKVQHILSQSETIGKASFYHLFEEPLNKFMGEVMAKNKLDLANDLPQLSWTGYVMVEDVLVHGNERFEPANANTPMSYAKRHAHLWNHVWREETAATSQ
ncbi:membrane-bound alpha-1,6- mannosyltransferase Initiation-specific [Chytriomyces hyalinus]|nr:membrane-bound alpha-1,6- mannosyltransferase Initiation-specific [Chytriomyces hyalinus]